MQNVGGLSSSRLVAVASTILPLGTSLESRVAPRRRFSLLALWFAAVLVLAVHHQFWRDEVRALSLALSGSGLLEMVKAVHGEGHPLLWYLLLRIAYAVFGTKQVLPAVALLVATASATLLIWRSPFNLLTIALLLFGYMMLFEYSVMARNYGISMLIMFTIATLYGRYRRHGYWMGVLLFLLINSNIHSVLIAAAFLLFWLLDLLQEDGIRWTPALGWVAINCCIAALGVIICALTVLPTYNDATTQPVAITMDAVARIATLNGFPLSGPKWAVPLLLAGATAGLARHPAAAVALGVAIIGFSAFSTLVYEIYPRQAYLVISFATLLYWISLDRTAKNPAFSTGGRQPRRRVETLGQTAFLVLLACQVPAGRTPIRNNLIGRLPESQAQAFGEFIRSRPDLEGAIIMGDPDFLLETLPYYLDNPLFLDRDRRFGRFVKFTRDARLNLTLTELLNDARSLSSSKHEPVVILISGPLDDVKAPECIQEGYNWTFSVNPAEVAKFQQSTELLGSFRPAVTDEQFDAYLLKTSANLPAPAARINHG